MTSHTGGADSASLKVYGKAVMEICMGTVFVESPCIVSDICDEVIIGADTFLCDTNGPAEIVSSEKKMLF